MGFRRQDGFTLVEIGVVLAIIGLMIVGVLIFVPAAQRGSRDNQRKGAVVKVETALEQWATIHSGSYGRDVSGSSQTVGILDLVNGGYLGTDVKDPSTGLAYVEMGDTGADYGQIAIRDRSGGTDGNNGYCIVIKLESIQPSSSGGGPDGIMSTWVFPGVSVAQAIAPPAGDGNGFLGPPKQANSEMTLWRVTDRDKSGKTVLAESVPAACAP